MAQNWLDENERYCVWTLRAWPYLQREIANALEWLCYLNGKSFRDYFELWQYPCMGRGEWAELHKVLPFEFFEDRQYFLDYAPKYLANYYKNIPSIGEELKQLVDMLQNNNYPFGSFLGAFRQLHEQLVHNPKQKGSLDFREYRSLDYYSLLAIRAEGCLRDKLHKKGTLANMPVKDQGLRGYIIDIAKQKNISQNVIDYLNSKEAKDLTYLGKTPDEPISAIMKIQKWNEKDTHLLQAFLCCLLARNYFAHHNYLDTELLNGQKIESGFMLTGILITVLTLLDRE